MNRSLQKLIDSKTTPYKDKDLLDIGVYHKTQVPQGERDWSELASMLDIDKTGEQFRQWVNYRQKQKGELPLQIEKEENFSIDKLQKERIKTRDAVNSYRRYLREDARLEALIEAIHEAASYIKLPNIKYDGKIKNSKKEAVLLYSDLHMGVDCHNFYNTYNESVAVARVQKLINDVISYCKANQVYKLNVCNLGDLIHGWIHTDSRIEQGQDVIEQIIAASQITAQMLVQLQAAAPKVIYRSCSDNHARVSPNKPESIVSENFGKLIDFYLQEALKTTSIEFINDNLDYGLGRFELDNGQICMFAHGHEDILNQVWQNYIGASREFVDYIFLGHLHNTKLKSFQGTKVIVNGSIVGTEQYALSKRLFGKAEQTLLMFDGDNVMQFIIGLQGAEYNG